jgi:hypothetical protein
MVAIQIRDVPDTVRDALVERARLAHKSLQGYLFDLLLEHARQPLPRDFERLTELRAGIDDDVDVDMVVGIIRSGREGRDEDWTA